MQNILLTKEEVIKIAYDYSELEIEPPDDSLFVAHGDATDSWVPLMGVV